MKLLLDACMWPGVASELRSLGHDVAYVGEWDSDPGDEAILDVAAREQRVLVTLDKDFGTLAIFHRRPHAGVIRIIEESVWLQAAMCQQVLDRHREALAASAVIVVERDRTRVRLPEDE